jgi:M6 family metalloprotease-like protein
VSGATFKNFSGMKDHHSPNLGRQLAQRLLLAMFWLTSAHESGAIMADPRPFDYTQPDGTRITLRLRGDEFFHWQEDSEGFTVMLESRTYVYATLNAQNQLVATIWNVGQIDPRLVGLMPRLLPPPEARLANLNNGLQIYRPWKAKPGKTGVANIAAQGTVKNLVVLCKFNNHTLGTHTRAPGDYNVLFNQAGGDPILAPTGSVRDAYLENSYNLVTLQSTVLAWVTLPQNQAYYAGTNSGLGGDYPNNAKKMVQDALALVDPLVDFGQFDTDNDGYIDAITIIHSGYGAETGGAPANSIWSHKGNLPADWVSADNNANGVKVKVNTYHTEPALWSTSGTNITRIGVISHELGHFFGLPDLYDTDYSGKGLGSWCMMANSWGFTGDQLRPPHFSAWCKATLNWTTPFESLDPATFILGQAETFAHSAKITHGFPAGEYLLIENRQPVGMDVNIPAGGLAIFHVDENVGSNSNEGFPGQLGWPANGNHYKIAMVQADGLFELERNITNGNAGDLYRAGGVTRFGPETSPSTDGYQSGGTCASGNIISGVSASGVTMSCLYSFYGRVIYVDKFYTGTSDGTCTRPYKNVSTAYAAAGNGDALQIRGADYPETPPVLNFTKRVDIYSLSPPVTVH